MPAAQEKPSGMVTTSVQPVLNPSSLPPKGDPAITLEPGNLAEYEQTWRLNATEWKGFLSEESYFDRELYLGDAELTRDGRATPWILTSSNLSVNSDGSRAILASSETILKHAYIAKNGKVENIISHGIGSVHCRPEYRGRGYAGKMISELGKRLDTWQQLKDHKGRFSVLYSDIGPVYYAKNGWKPFLSTHISLKPIDAMHYDRLTSQHHFSDVQDLRLADLEALPLSAGLEHKLASASKMNHDKTFVAFKPTAAVFEWHFRREQFLAEILGREQPDIKGAIDKETGIALIWSRTYSAESAGWHLSMLYTHIPHDVFSANQIRPSLAALLLRAQREADVWDLEAGVEIWDPSEDVIAAAKVIANSSDDVQVVERDQEHICSLKWNGPETDEVVWLANERYAWC